jgi:hypothetical protein
MVISSFEEYCLRLVEVDIYASGLTNPQTGRRVSIRPNILLAVLFNIDELSQETID